MLSGRRLNAEQERAFLHLVQTPSAIRFLHGLAGTGKTSFTLRACIDAWQQEGFEVLGAAPTAKAAQVLHSDTGITCDTIHALMGDYDVGGGVEAAKHHLRQLGRAAVGKKTRKRHKPKPVKLNRKSILVIDESGMVNLHQFRLLLEHVEKSGATIVFLGDPYQLPPVEGTAPFQSLSRSVGFAQLTDIQRQKQQWARDASRHFYMGEPGKALKLFADHDRLILGENADQTKQKLGCRLVAARSEHSRKGRRHLFHEPRVRRIKRTLPAAAARCRTARSGPWHSSATSVTTACTR